MVYSKVNGVLAASIAKIDGVAIASVAEVNGVAAPALTQAWPVWYNFEDDNIDDTGTLLWAKATHYDGRDAATVQADDAGDLPAMPGMDQCFYGAGATVSPYVELLLDTDEGWTPEDNETIRVEAIICGGGTGAQVYFYFRDSALQEGVFFLLLNNGRAIARTETGGSMSGNLLDTDIGVNAFTYKYSSVQVRYGFGTKKFEMRAMPLGHSDYSDTGWVNVGTISSPTYSTTTEMVHLQVNNYNTPDDEVSLAQVTLDKDADNDAVVRVSNYVDPS